MISSKAAHGGTANIAKHSTQKVLSYSYCLQSNYYYYVAEAITENICVVKFSRFEGNRENSKTILPQKFPNIQYAFTFDISLQLLIMRLYKYVIHHYFSAKHILGANLPQRFLLPMFCPITAVLHC